MRCPQRSASAGRIKIRWRHPAFAKATADEADATAPRILLRFQRDEAAAALTPDADQNLFVRLQFLADGNQIFRVFHRLLVHFLDHVAFAQASFCGGRSASMSAITAPLNVLWKIKRGADVLGDIRYRHAAEHSCFFRLRGFFRRCLGALVSSTGRHLGKLDVERFASDLRD